MPPDPYHHGPGSDALPTLIGAKHGLGGVAGSEAKATDDDGPDRLAIVQPTTWAYLHCALYEGEASWLDACKALKDWANLQGRVERK